MLMLSFKITPFHLHQDESFTRRLVAAGVAYTAVLFPGRDVRLRIVDHFAVVELADIEAGPSDVDSLGDAAWSFWMPKPAVKEEVETLKLGRWDEVGKNCHRNSVVN